MKLKKIQIKSEITETSRNVKSYTQALEILLKNFPPEYQIKNIKPIY